MRAGHRITISLGVSAVIALGGCGGGDPRFSDSKIIDKLNLKQSESGYAIDGDPFCEVDKRLLNDSDEVNAAADGDKLGLVIASGEGNVGIQGVPPFAPDCEAKAKKKLNRLDRNPAG